MLSQVRLRTVTSAYHCDSQFVKEIKLAVRVRLRTNDLSLPESACISSNAKELGRGQKTSAYLRVQSLPKSRHKQQHGSITLVHSFLDLYTVPVPYTHSIVNVCALVPVLLIWIYENPFSQEIAKLH